MHGGQLSIGRMDRVWVGCGTCVARGTADTEMIAAPSERVLKNCISASVDLIFRELHSFYIFCELIFLYARSNFYGVDVPDDSDDILRIQLPSCM